MFEWYGGGGGWWWWCFVRVDVLVLYCCFCGYGVWVDCFGDVDGDGFVFLEEEVCVGGGGGG